LAEEVVRLAKISTAEDHFAYNLSDSIADKLQKIATRVYRADGIELSPTALAQTQQLETAGFSNLPVCIAKTQYSFSDQPQLLGAPRGFKISINRVEVRAGAGFLVAFAGNILTMPGLPKIPAAEQIDVDDSGNITGIF
jgi:formate--tetrahydrofolate ligase